MKPRRKYIQVDRSRHGQIRYYFRRPHCRRVRLPGDYGSPRFWEAYRAALQGQPTAPPERPTVKIVQRGKIDKALERLLRGVRNRARRDGLAFDLTYEWAIATVEAQGFECALTGIPFFASPTAKCRVNPFGPSFDRIDCRGGYTQGNVRIVAYAVNVMLMDWGEIVFAQIVNRYRATLAKRRTSIP